MTKRIADTEAVLATMQRYIDGTNDADVTLLRSAFHANAVMTGWMGGHLMEGTPEPFFQHVANTPAPAKQTGAPYSGRITEVRVLGNTATATLIEDNLYGVDFVDFFHLSRGRDGQWLIVSKLFHQD